MYFMFKFIFAIPYSTPGGLEINEAGCSTPWTTSLVDRQKKPDRKVSTMRRLDMTGEWNVLKEHLDVACGSYP